MTKKEITNSQVVDILRKEIKSTEEKLSKKIEEDTEFLARISNSNFGKIDKKINKVHKDLKSDINQINGKLNAEVERKDDVNLRIKEVKTRVEVLEKQVL